MATFILHQVKVLTGQFMLRNSMDSQVGIHLEVRPTIHDVKNHMIFNAFQEEKLDNCNIFLLK